MNKFATLIELAKIWESLDTKDFINVLKHLLEIDSVGIYQNAIISGIFQQLYRDGESNDDIFLADLLVVSQQQSQPFIIKATNQIEHLPDGLLCDIASYLEAEHVFTKWNHVNRKFLQIGLRPESIKHFEFGIFRKNKVIKYPPQFKFDVTLSKLESLDSIDAKMGGLVMNQVGMKFVKHLAFDGNNCDISTAGNGIECVDVLWDHIDWSDHGHKIYRLVQDYNVTRVKHFVRSFSKVVNVSDDEIEHTLQLLIPESPKSIELNQRLNSEITQEQRNKLHSWEIEKLENNIKNEIELKYNTFDVNELNEISDDMNKYKYTWSTSIELLELSRLNVQICNIDKTTLMQMLENRITPERVKTAYKNLKSLILDIDETDWDNKNDFGNFIGAMILNNLACQLESLHIDEGCDAMGMWKLVSNDYPCTNDAINSSWFPRNIKHLCVRRCHAFREFTNLAKFTMLWDKADSKIFPNLKHLTIHFPERYNPITDELTNLQSFIDHGLTSLCITSEHGHMANVFQLLSYIDDILNQKKKKENVKQVNYSDFILKMDLNVSAQVEDLKNNLIDGIYTLYLSLIKRFDHVMFSFKIWAWFHSDTIVIEELNYFNELVNDPRLTVENTKLVDSKCRHISPNGCYFYVVLKHRINNMRDIDCNNTQGSSDFCHREPRHKFECCYCEPVE